MAINKETLKTRAITAFIFVLIVLTAIFYNGWSFFILFCIILIGCIIEFVKILKLIHPDRYSSFFPFVLIYPMLSIFLMIDLGFNGPGSPLDLPRFIHNGFAYSPIIPVAILCSLWVNDTMAYLVGSWIGKTPFSAISPKKTWEGTLGGILLCVLAISIAGYLIPAAHSLQWQQWMVFALIVAIAGTAGDLFESKLKRMAGIKDSGAIMPGHGGFLDRFDSLLFAVPFIWLYIQLIF